MILFQGNFHDRLDLMMNCTENSTASIMSYSLIPIEDTYRLICQPKFSPKIGITFSVFNIGEYVYFQTQQLFYRYVPKEDKPLRIGFVYDKQVTELLNDIFGKQITIVFKQKDII